ncbi:MAG TPA: hypothetical protein VFA37_07415 [Gaiellaceae bacterium]|nr:hypothetical protein [Gaiellaceae bacterium]
MTTRNARWLGGLAAGLIVLTLAASSYAAPGDTFRVSLTYNGGQANDQSVDAAISGDGSRIAFKSLATNLLATADANGNTRDIFVRDRNANTTYLASVDPNGNQFTQTSEEPAISYDGSTVAWETNGQIYVRTIPNGTTQLVSKAPDGSPGDGVSHAPQLSANGRYVTYWSVANNIVANDPKFTADVFTYDTQTGTNELDSVGTGGTPAAIGQDSFLPSISGDGRYVVFETLAPFSGLDTNNAYDIYVHDRQANTTKLVSHNIADTAAGNAPSFEGNGGPKISEDGSTIAFTSLAGNLSPNDTNNHEDVFVYHMATDKIEQASVDSNGTEYALDSSRATINGDGTFVAFESANEFTPQDTGTNSEIWVRNLTTQTTSLESLNYQGNVVTGDKLNPSIDGDGMLVAYHSSSGDLVSGDTNTVEDVFVHQLGAADTTPPTVTGTPTTAPNANGWYNGPVTVHWTAVDPAPSSGQPGPLPDTVVNTTGQNQVITSPRACDGDGNCATGSVTLSIDTAPPTVSASTNTPGTHGWYNHDVVVGFSCNDALSGIQSCPAPLHFTSEGTNLQSSVSAPAYTATDRAGNSATATLPTVNIDETPPVITFSGAQTYGLDDTVTITCSATDALSGVAAGATCPSVSAPASSFGVGTTTLTAIATDLAGNTATATYTFSVSADDGDLLSTACNDTGWSYAALLAGTKPVGPTQTAEAALCQQLVNDLQAAINARNKGDTNGMNTSLRKFLSDAAAAVGTTITLDQDVALTKLADDLPGSTPSTTCTTGPGAGQKCESLLADPTVASNTKLQIVAMDDSPIQTSGSFAPTAVLSTGQNLTVSTSATSGQPPNYVDTYGGSTGTKNQTLITITLPSGLPAGSYTVKVSAWDTDGPDLDQWSWPITVASSGTVTSTAKSSGPAPPGPRTPKQNPRR